MAVISTGDRATIAPEADRPCALCRDCAIGRFLPKHASYQRAVHLCRQVCVVDPAVADPDDGLSLALVWGAGGTVSACVACRVCIGPLGVALLVLPDTSCRMAASSVAWGCRSPGPCRACYAFEGNYVARWGTAGRTLWAGAVGASVMGRDGAAADAGIGSLVSSPFIPVRGAEWFFSPPLLVLSSVVHGWSYTLSSG